MKPVDVVDFGPFKVLIAHGIDVESDAIGLERLVELANLVFEIEVIAELPEQPPPMTRRRSPCKAFQFPRFP